ncbi:glycosyl hydrolases family 18-domain-containing protein [Cunninghamella echinulata]|nr:glycosyl hydrolases family 18-domain-containing protein [Cunninghamella echinulata]
MVASSQQRQKFIQWHIDFIQKYKTDGIDIDWEYPSKQGAGCNEVNDLDTQHFLVLLKELRKSLDKTFPNDHKLVTMAVHLLPFTNQHGVPSSDVSSFVPYFDFINIMTYDMNGVWSGVTGPNAPFKAEANKGNGLSFVQSIQAWRNAGIPKEKINAGLAFYGRSMQAKQDMTILKSQYQIANQDAPQGDADDVFWTDLSCPSQGDRQGGYSGIWKWSHIRSQGLLSKDYISTGKGWLRFWDEVSKTPWLFHTSSKIYISYDDPQSLGIKIEHVVCEDLAGVMIWDIHQDKDDELINAVSKINTESFKCPHSLSTKNTKSRKFEQIQQTNNDVGSSSDVIMPIEGTECSLSQKSICIESGISNKWFTCDMTHWITRECPKDLTCHDIQGGVLCDYTIEEKLFMRFKKQLLKLKDMIQHISFPTDANEEKEHDK